MEKIKKISRPISFLLALVMILLAGPYQGAMAAMVRTETMLSMSRGGDARAYVQSVLAREDVQKTFAEQGINPAEATERVNSLSDAEIIRLADQIGNLPAGGDMGLISALIIVLLVIVIIKII